jgi:hypothetical protein
VGAPALGACPPTSGFGLVQGHGTFRGFTMGPPNRSMGLKPSLLCAPFGELPLHHEAEGVAFFLFPISPPFANAAPSKPPPSRCYVFCSRVNRGAPAGLPGPCQTPPRYGLTRFSSLRRLGGLGGIPGATSAAAGQVRSQFGPSVSHVCACGDFPVACVKCPALDPCRAYPRARQMLRCIYFVPARSLGHARPPRTPNSQRVAFLLFVSFVQAARATRGESG